LFGPRIVWKGNVPVTGGIYPYIRQFPTPTGNAPAFATPGAETISIIKGQGLCQAMQTSCEHDLCWLTSVILVPSAHGIPCFNEAFSGGDSVGEGHELLHGS
jgi:hypothetical protein